MKLLLCGFADLIDQSWRTPDKISVQHLPFSADEVQRADVAAVCGDGRVLILKNRLGHCGVLTLQEFLMGNAESKGPFG